MDDTRLLEEAITNAKEFQHFDKVVMAVSLHPEWLTLIPENREWSILHQIVFSGNLDHLDRVLALQKGSSNFNPLIPSRHGETIVDVAAKRLDAPEVKARIQKLIKLDTMLTDAKVGNWAQCYELVKQNPTFANEKPPYRGFYLIHHMAYVGALDQLKCFQEIPNCRFQVTLRAFGKTAPTIARENSHPQFAEYLEQKYKALFEDDDDANLSISYPASDQAKSNTRRVNLAMEQANVMSNLDGHLKDKSTGPGARTALMAKLELLEKERKEPSHTVPPSDKRQEEATSIAALRNVLTCPLSNEIYVDPGMYDMKNSLFLVLPLSC